LFAIYPDNMTYDLIVITASTHPDLIANTQNTIDSCLADKAKVRVIVVETGPEYKYRDADVIVPYKGEFNYNRALNTGLKHRKYQVQILANNDIIFKPGWSKIGDIMKANKYLSASALSNDFRQNHFLRGDYAYEGYFIGFQLTGWCIFCRKELWKLIGPLDERHKFWFSDNAYAEQLEAKGIPHALICSVTVDHLGSRTLKKLDSRTQLLYTHAERKNINAKG